MPAGATTQLGKSTTGQPDNWANRLLGKSTTGQISKNQQNRATTGQTSKDQQLKQKQNRQLGKSIKTKNKTDTKAKKHQILIF